MTKYWLLKDGQVLVNDYLLGMVSSVVAGSLILPFLCRGLASSGIELHNCKSHQVMSLYMRSMCISLSVVSTKSHHSQSAQYSWHTIHNRYNTAGIGLGRSSHVLALDGIFHSFFLNRKWRMS